MVNNFASNSSSLAVRLTSFILFCAPGDVLSDLCLHRSRHTDGCENHTANVEESSGDTSNGPGVSSLDVENPDLSGTQADSKMWNSTSTPILSANPTGSQGVTHSTNELLPAPPISSLHNPPDVSITGYQSINGPKSGSQLPTTYPFTGSKQLQTSYNARDRSQQPYRWSNQRYSVDLDSGSIQEQLDTQDQWWPDSYRPQSHNNYQFDSD
ncbi:hypothetical protein FBUS_07766 [Fasciolopsis buskii]|uniref:Uncharacterized protein n=1 Tax=Fasciolopsis buskii TaxID=27845 RepID=A0A8E0RY20_9TREM|nr:hypothetical protein FBUS_07766 [Fasciolopsis buski]